MVAIKGKIRERLQLISRQVTMFKQVFLVFAAIAVVSALPPRVMLPVFPEQLTLEEFDGRIINGNEAYLGQIPYQANILSFLDGASSGAFCGASLIQPLWLLTAAHCVESTDYTIARLGMVRIGAQTYSETSRDRTIHPNYNNQNLNNDVAVIRLPVAATGSNIGTIELAPAGVGDLVGETVRASGYGRTVDNGAVSDVLYYVDLQAITNAQCQSTYGSIVISSTLCATYITASGDSTCNGDSGGPLTWNNQLVGVVSFVSTAGCASGAPSGYARVSSFRDWIDANTV